MMGWEPFLPSSYVRQVLNANTAWTAQSTEHATLKIYSGVCVCVCVYMYTQHWNVGNVPEDEASTQFIYWYLYIIIMHMEILIAYGNT